MAYQALKDNGKNNPGTLKALVNALTTASTSSTHKQYSLKHTYTNYALQVVTGTTKVDKIILEGSLDGTNWDTIAGSTWIGGTQASGDIIYITGKPLSNIRANWVTKATTTAINAYIAPG